MANPLVSHLFRRGLEAAHDHLSPKQAFIQHLQHDAELYDKSGENVEPYEILPMIITALFALFVICSIEYTLGQVMASLAMIETPTSTAIVEPKPPAYADSPNASAEKEPLMPSEAEADVEITVINHKPITSKVVTTIGHLHRIGGFRARWRGLGNAALYTFVRGVISHLFAALFGFGVIGMVIGHILASVALSRLHMAWTMKMIAHPSNKWWFKRLPSPKDSRALLLPNLVYATAEQATVLLPVAVGLALGVFGPPHAKLTDGPLRENCGKIIFLFFRFLAVPMTYLAMALLVLLPATVTLTRIEAALMPTGEEAIVPFDKEALLPDCDLSNRHGRRALFVEAWRSFDRASRWNLVKLYAKIALAQFTVAFVAVHLIFAEMYLLGMQKISILIKSGLAQVKLAAIEAHEHHQ